MEKGAEKALLMPVFWRRISPGSMAARVAPSVMPSRIVALQSRPSTTVVPRAIPGSPGVITNIRDRTLHHGDGNGDTGR